MLTEELVRVMKAALYKSRYATAAVAMTALLASPAGARTLYEQAQVLDATPVYETVTQRVPVEQCAVQRVAYRADSGRRSVTAPILGAIIGGAIGNAVGHEKRNRQVGTAVGALLGGSIGADIARHRRSHGERVTYRNEEVCEIVDEVREEERLAGYDVRYTYGGQVYQSRMPRDPGETLRVRVRVSPAE